MKLLTLSLVAILFSCSKNELGFKKGRTFIGNQQVSAEVLTLGKHVYLEYCAACHGENGDGNGPAAKGSLPPPRNFKQGLYKFGYSADGGLPSDHDFVRIIQGGLNGTAMFKWDISKDQALAVTQYIKTFAPQVWENKDNEKGIKVELSPDPYSLARKEAAIIKGKEVYHMVANCQTCHQAYISKDEFSKLNEKYNGEKLSADDFEADFYQLKIQESEYYFYDSEERFAKYLPPDFTWHELRSINNVEDIAWRLAAGVTGSGMPAWKGTIEDHEIWAVAYYVDSLMKLKKNKEARRKLKETLK